MTSSQTLLPLARGEGQADRILLDEAPRYASKLAGRSVTAAQLGYLISYGRLRKLEGSRGGRVYVSRGELATYYASQRAFEREQVREADPQLAFAQISETESTKHVHRLHPYKGKFTPQLTAYFLAPQESGDAAGAAERFSACDLVFDPFSGSGTTLVVAHELGLDAIGVDVSAFNVLIGNAKLRPLDLGVAARQIESIAAKLAALEAKFRTLDEELGTALQGFNREHFPSPQFKRQVYLKTIDEKAYGRARAEAFMPRYRELLAAHGLRPEDLRLPQARGFLDRWLLRPIREQIDLAAAQIATVEDEALQQLLRLILSRTLRSSRATTHFDLTTLVEPVIAPYYCRKHGKLCRPSFSASRWWRRYGHDTLRRLAAFRELRTETHQLCLAGDARHLELESALRTHNGPAYDREQAQHLIQKLKRRGLRGIFSSPPYLGLIDYHEQHAYAYELFGIPRRDADEIGAMQRGQGAKAREAYVEGIAAVLLNALRYRGPRFDVFLVANDKHGLYPRIAERAGLRIVKEWKRPVLRRSERSRQPYTESIFHMIA